MISPNHKPTSRNSFQNFSQSKNKDFKAQIQSTKEAFHEAPKTMLQVEKEIGVMRSNITRYVDSLRKLNQIYLTHYGICPISKHRSVGFYTTNPDLIPEDNQLNLFS